MKVPSFSRCLLKEEGLQVKQVFKAGDQDLGFREVKFEALVRNTSGEFSWTV